VIVSGLISQRVVFAARLLDFPGLYLLNSVNPLAGVTAPAYAPGGNPLNAPTFFWPILAPGFPYGANVETDR